MANGHAADCHCPPCATELVGAVVEQGLSLDHDKLAACFAEWQRRYAADPGAFAAEWPQLPATEYGAQCAAYMLQLAEELKVNG